MLVLALLLAAARALRPGQGSRRRGSDGSDDHLLVPAHRGQRRRDAEDDRGLQRHQPVEDHGEGRVRRAPTTRSTTRWSPPSRRSNPPELVVAYQNQSATYAVNDALVDMNLYVKDPKWGLGKEHRRLLRGLHQPGRQRAVRRRSASAFPPTAPSRSCTAIWPAEIRGDHGAAADLG